MITSDGSKRSEEFGPEGPDAPVDVHWASVFPELPSSEMAQLERRGLGHIFTWLRYQRGSDPVCRATVRLGLLGLYASGHEGPGGVEDQACLVDVIHSKDSTEATALHQTLVVRGWGGANLLTPRSSLRHLTARSAMARTCSTTRSSRHTVPARSRCSFRTRAPSLMSAVRRCVSWPRLGGSR